MQAAQFGDDAPPQGVPDVQGHDFEGKDGAGGPVLAAVDDPPRATAQDAGDTQVTQGDVEALCVWGGRGQAGRCEESPWRYEKQWHAPAWWAARCRSRTTNSGGACRPACRWRDATAGSSAGVSAHRRELSWGTRNALFPHLAGSGDVTLGGRAQRSPTSPPRMDKSWALGVRPMPKPGSCGPRRTPPREISNPWRKSRNVPSSDLVGHKHQGTRERAGRRRQVTVHSTGACRGCRSEHRTHSSYGTSATGTSMGAGFGFLSRLALAGAGGVGAGSGGGDWSLSGVVSPIVGVHRRAGFTVLGAVPGAVCTYRRLGGAPWPPGSGPRRVEQCESDTKGGRNLLPRRRLRCCMPIGAGSDATTRAAGQRAVQPLGSVAASCESHNWM